MRYFACLLVSCTANTANLYRVLLCIEFVHQKLCDLDPVPRAADILTESNLKLEVFQN